MVQYGLGILRLPSVNNTVTGSITVSNGTLVASSSGGDLDVMSGAALGAGGLGTVGTLSVGGNLNMTSGTLLVTLNKSLSPSNSTVTVAGATTITGSTLKLLNYGPALVAGDKFTVFSGAVTGLTILSPGYTFADNNDGSYTVTSVAAGSPAITHSVSAGQLTLTWPAAWTGLVLQVQTNTLQVGLKSSYNSWFNVPGSASVSSYVAPVFVSSNTCVFYRLVPE